MPPLLEWWQENYLLLRDIVTRRYRVHVQSYDGLLAGPEKVVRETIAWLGTGDAEAAAKAVKPEHRTQRRASPESNGARLELDPAFEEIFELLYATVDERRPLGAEVIGRFNEVNADLLPRIKEAQKAVFIDAQRRRAAGQSRPDDPGQDDMPSW
jgi:hypothetical protein